MFRAVLELLLTLIIALAARAVLTSVFKGIANASSNAFRNQGGTEAPGETSGTRQTPSNPKRAGDLHRDPVCGTFVAESTPYRRQSAGELYYYCSSECRERHSLVTR